MGTIPEEVLLYKIKQETAAREAAIAALLSQLDNATAESQQKITAVASKLNANINGRSVNSSAIAGVILTSQVAPGFAYASQLTLLEAKVTSDALLSVARITELREVTATEFEAKAQQILTIQATFNASKAKFTEDILANANATSAVTSRTTTLEATVNNPTSGVVASSARITAEETTRATQTSALATRSTALEATVNNATTGVAATLARLVTEETTRATADTAVANRTTTLESTVNNGTTGVAATSARLTTEENTRATQTSALATRATTLESTVNNPTTGVAAAIARITAEESTRASADSAISSSVTTLTSTVNGQSANITTLQTTTSNLSSSLSTLQTTVSSQGVSITTAQSGANAAQTAANTAQNAANAAQNTANEKIKTFIQGTTPTALAVGDLWIDTANNNKIKRWSGSAWVDASDVRITTLSSSVDSIATANTTRDSTVANLTTTVSAQSTAISNAQGTANTASAAVTTEANARANADGTLSARASLYLDVNGNISGYKIGSSVNLDGVTTSEFSVTADTFKIYNGSSKVSPFSVSGGVVSMTNVKVASSVDIGSGMTRTRIDTGGLKVGSYVEFNTDGGLDTYLKFTSTYQPTRGMVIRSGSQDPSIVIGSNLYTNVQSVGFYADGYGSTIRSLTVYDGLSVTGGNLSVANAATITGNTYSGSFSSNGNTSSGSFSSSGNASFDSLNIATYASINGAGFSNSTFNLHPGSNNSMSTGEDGGAYGAQSGAYLAFRVNGRTVWVPFFTALP
jgi:hypothetical protein